MVAKKRTGSLLITQLLLEADGGDPTSRTAEPREAFLTERHCLPGRCFGTDIHNPSQIADSEDWTPRTRVLLIDALAVVAVVDVVRLLAGERASFASESKQLAHRLKRHPLETHIQAFKHPSVNSTASTVAPLTHSRRCPCKTRRRMISVTIAGAAPRRQLRLALFAG